MKNKPQRVPPKPVAPPEAHFSINQALQRTALQRRR
jgi:hypothetical protein